MIKHFKHCLAAQLLSGKTNRSFHALQARIITISTCCAPIKQPVACLFNVSIRAMKRRGHLNIQHRIPNRVLFIGLVCINLLFGLLQAEMGQLRLLRISGLSHFLLNRITRQRRIPTDHAIERLDRCFIHHCMIEPYAHNLVPSSPQLGARY